ncbi:MAG: hypothetical protein ACK4N4_14055, partial [Burkholderiales bacterium]
QALQPGVSKAKVAQDLGIHGNMLRKERKRGRVLYYDILNRAPHPKMTGVRQQETPAPDFACGRIRAVRATPR